jgi:hypothetical protein
VAIIPVIVPTVVLVVAIPTVVLVVAIPTVVISVTRTVSVPIEIAIAAAIIAAVVSAITIVSTVAGRTGSAAVPVAPVVPRVFSQGFLDLFDAPPLGLDELGTRRVAARPFLRGAVLGMARRSLCVAYRCSRRRRRRFHAILNT